MTEIKIGRYQIRDELGEGGMGTVYLAYDSNLGREVALKLLHPYLFSHDPAFSLRFEQEARTIAALDHSHIIPLYEFGEDSNGLYFVMRLMKGGTLRDKLARGPLSLDETIAILERVGSALDHAHRNGIVHRDLKPGNILFDREGNAFLGDFGIIKTDDADRFKTRTGQTLGTPHYMSPEQVDGKKIDGRSDIYALGVIFYEMLTGNQPYDHSTSTVRVMNMHLAAPIPSLLQAKPDLPPPLEAVLQKAMAKEPSDRFTTAQEMVTAVKAATVVPKKRSFPRWVWGAGGLAAILMLVWGISAALGNMGKPTELFAATSPATPTNRPSVTVTNGPSVMPTILPSATPTNRPSATPTATPSNTPQPSTPTRTLSPPTTTIDPNLASGRPQLRITVGSVNIRNGPGTNYRVISTLPIDSVVTVVAKNPNASWFLIELTGSSRGWIAASTTEPVVVADMINVQVAATIPSSPTATTKTATPAPQPTNAAIPTPQPTQAVPTPTTQAPPTPTPVPISSTIVVINNTAIDICYLYIDLSTDPWTDDRLGEDILWSGSQITFNFPAGEYDFMAFDCDDELVADMYFVFVSGMFTWDIR